MADNTNPIVNINTFTKGMVKDYNESYVGEGLWTHARNAVNNSHDGQIGVIGNEPSNLKCVQLPYTLIGTIHLLEDKWAIFTTDNTNSEIGIFSESKCGLPGAYQTVINCPCLNFSTKHLITGIYRKRYDCERLIYWDDGLNPTRFMDIDNPPLVSTITTTGTCVTTTPVIPHQLDCEKIRVAPHIIQPCISLSKGSSGGSIPNGSYQACLAYCINGVKVTDIIGLSNVQSVFSHENVNSALDVKITNIDTSFDEFDLTIIGNFNGQTVAKKIGTYTTAQGLIHVDRFDNEFVNVPISDVVLRTEPIEKSDAIYAVNNYALRVGVYSKFKFNYQLQANNIIAKWIAVEYPADYYIKGGNKTGYMRDEQYAFFIRWVYNTGEFSESYHIPGRAPIPSDLLNITSDDVYEGSAPTWQVYNTASVTNNITNNATDGLVIASGLMGYWESTELYSPDKPNIWGPLCGKPIRHHKFPDETVGVGDQLSIFKNSGDSIVLLGVEFENITHPLDQNGKPIESIVGYEILRGSREGNKTIIGKGLFNNMVNYVIPGNTNAGLMQNYPYNDLRHDNYMNTKTQDGENGTVDPLNFPADRDPNRPINYTKNIFSFHSPEVTFSNPFLNTAELKIYGEYSGISNGRFSTPYKHPKAKFPSDFTSIISNIVGFMGAAASLAGGIDIAADGEIPVSFKLGGAPPSLPILTSAPAAGGDITGDANMIIAEALNIAKDAITTGLFVAELAALISMYGALSDVYSEKVMQLFRVLIPKRQYAAQYISHGFYNTFKQINSGNKRRSITLSSYVNNGLQQFGLNYQINNLNRSRVVVVQTNKDVAYNPTIDDSRFTMGEINASLDNDYTKTVASYYGALKINMLDQYNQLDSIKQIPISTCINNTTPDKTTKYTSPILFGGDIYINRFTEKNTMFFFNNWLMGEPDEIEYDYTQYINVPYPKFWINTKYLSHGFMSMAHQHRVLDMRDSSTFYVNRGYFYLFNSGVRDFFVESEINLAYRDWEDDMAKRHYDPYRYTDLTSMFRSDVIRSGNYYKYDYSLTIGKLFNSSITWGSLLPREYDPVIETTCFTYRPNRVIYSLPQNDESKQDSLRVFLANNYKDFKSNITAIKAINKTGAIFMMKSMSPMMFAGIEQLTLDTTGTKVTIGDGALFAGAQQLQSVVNADESYEYASNQGRYTSINTTHGVFWVSQNQGKIFQFSSGLNEISRDGMKWWFAQHLPSELLKIYPDYPLYDNPVKGIGVQTIYDQTNEIIYITKKDYKPLRNDLMYDDGGFYYIDGSTTITIPGTTTTRCPPGYALINGVCTLTETTPPVPTTTTVLTTRTPYLNYGAGGAFIYNPGYSKLLTTTGSWDQLGPGTGTTVPLTNSFWIQSLTSGGQSVMLDSGCVNRAAIWGKYLNGSGNPYNNYNFPSTPSCILPNGNVFYTASLCPVETWIGFTQCITIAQDMTVFVALAADNDFAFYVDDMTPSNYVVATADVPSTTYPNTGSGTSNSNTFGYMHIFPVKLLAGTHQIKVIGRNSGQLACFAAEIYAFDTVAGLGLNPTVTQVYNHLNTNINNITDMYSTPSKINVLFSTRNASQFDATAYACPTTGGWTQIAGAGGCGKPECTRTLTVAPTVVTTPSTTQQVPIKVYCNFDSVCWEDASWTISYDPKNKMWISFHDWHPTFLIPGKAHFMSVNLDSIWKHNVRCDSYCNFYDVDYPFDVEFISTTGQTVTSVRNIEYMLEAYKLYNNCADKFHMLDVNFDYSIVYNSEQLSGLLKLNLKSRTNPLDSLNFPKIQSNYIDINYSKIEQKYRFNEFWDITKDRGEFTGVTTPMFITKANGYNFNINPSYVDYNKAPIERKKFRHNINRVFLRKSVSKDVKILFKISNLKLLNSPR